MNLPTPAPVIQPATGLDLLGWMYRYRKMLEADRRFDLRQHVYLRALYEERSQRVVLFKASQVGVSEYLISYAIHACDQRQATALYVFPTNDLVGDFSTARLGPAIEASPYLARLVEEAGGGRRGTDRVTLKRVRNRFLYLRGGTVKPDGKAPQLKSIPADVLILDELDEMDARAPVIARKRLGHSGIAEERIASTPTYPGRGIHREWQSSDMREWFVQCGGCGNRQPMTINDIVIEWDTLGRPVAWHGQQAGAAFVACRKCGKAMDRLQPGEWVATMPGSETVGYHVTKFMSPLVSLDDIVSNLDTVDETKRREAFNQDLGETYTPRGGSLSTDILDACKRDYATGPVASETCFMGVDVGRVWHVVIRGKINEQGERPLRFAGDVPSAEEVGRLIRLYNPRTVVIDALPETSKVRELQAAHRKYLIWPAYYGVQKVGSKKEDAFAWDYKEQVANLDRTRTLDETFARFIDHGNTLPANVADIRDYYAHLMASVRVLEKDTYGQEIARYVESGPDHFAHAENYCMAASECPMGASWVRGA